MSSSIVAPGALKINFLPGPGDGYTYVTLSLHLAVRAAHLGRRSHHQRMGRRPAVKCSMPVWRKHSGWASSGLQYLPCSDMAIREGRPPL